MPSFSHTPKLILRLIHLPPRAACAIGLGQLIGKFVMLLTTTGRKSGKRRVTPLQYEEIDGRIYVGAALGRKADWMRNILADPRVEVRIKARRFMGCAEVVSDTRQIADFLEERLRRHPRMIGAMLRAEGMPMPPDRAVLEQYAARLALVIITPDPEPLAGSQR